MADPLKCFQEICLKEKKIIDLEFNGETYYIFGEYAFPKNALTRFPNSQKKGIYYDIESLKYFWENREDNHAAYVKKAIGKGGLTVIGRPDRQSIIKYLEGEDSIIDDNDPNAPKVSPLYWADMVKKSDFEPDRKKLKLDPNVPESYEGYSEEIGDDKLNDNGRRSLNSDLTAEKIAMLKNKAKKHKKNMIQSGEDDDNVMEMDPSIAKVYQRVSGARERLDERTCHDRTSFMDGNVTQFEHFCTMYRNFIEKKKKPQNMNESNKKVANQQLASTQQPSGYSRYDQEKFSKHDSLGFEINPNLTFQGTALRSLSTAVNAKSLLSTNVQQNSRSPGTPLSSVNRSDSTNSLSNNQKRKSRTPIIIIPSSHSSLITLYNVSDILQDLKFISTSEKKDLQKIKRPTEVIIHRKKDNGDTVHYRVVESPLGFTDEEWERVVAVFVQGPSWQFKGWQWKGNPVDILANVLGFHLKFDCDKPEDNIKQWSVNILDISKTRRHLDKASLLKFWQILDRWIVKHKPNLRF
uniref:CDC73_C domain-containing protein n=1 Tax=Parastrongyloides trichosuri TaxID=131310 RepID=A0A0N4ZTC7_PARTI